MRVHSLMIPQRKEDKAALLAKLQEGRDVLKEREGLVDSLMKQRQELQMRLARYVLVLATYLPRDWNTLHGGFWTVFGSDSVGLLCCAGWGIWNANLTIFDRS